MCLLLLPSRSSAWMWIMCQTLKSNFKMGNKKKRTEAVLLASQAKERVWPQGKKTWFFLTEVNLSLLSVLIYILSSFLNCSNRRDVLYLSCCCHIKHKELHVHAPHGPVGFFLSLFLLLEFVKFSRKRQNTVKRWR